MSITPNFIKLSQIKKQFGQESVEAFLEVLFFSLNESLNIRRKLTSEQMVEISIFIYDDYYYLNVAELNLIFSRIKKGFYGQLYEGIDVVKIMGFFEQYCNERRKFILSKKEEEKFENSKSMQERTNFILSKLKNQPFCKRLTQKKF